MQLICFNGAFFPYGTPLISLDNTSYKWGDGLFETILVKNGTIMREALHMERLTNGLKLLGIDSSLPKDLTTNIIELCEKNQCLRLGRVRLSVFRIIDDKFSYGIEAKELPEQFSEFNEQGWTLGIYPYARKSMDAFSNLKTSSHVHYIMASHYARDNHFDEVIVLNNAGRIADCSRTNLFLVKNHKLYTPALSEGCIAGVMRTHLLNQFRNSGISIHQGMVNEEQLLDADEVFLTNALVGIQPVSRYKDKTYSIDLSRELYQLYV